MLRVKHDKVHDKEGKEVQVDFKSVFDKFADKELG